MGTRLIFFVRRRSLFGDVEKDGCSVCCGVCDDCGGCCWRDVWEQHGLAQAGAGPGACAVVWVGGRGSDVGDGRLLGHFGQGDVCVGKHHFANHCCGLWIYAPTSTSPSICAEQSVLAAYLMEHSVTAKVNLELIEQANGGTLPPNTITLCASFNGTKWSQSGVKGSVEVEANIVYSPFNHNTMWSGDPNLGSFYLPFL